MGHYFVGPVPIRIPDSIFTPDQMYQDVEYIPPTSEKRRVVLSLNGLGNEYWRFFFDIPKTGSNKEDTPGVPSSPSRKMCEGGPRGNFFIWAQKPLGLDTIGEKRKK